MTSKTEKDRQKQIQDKCQAILTQMLRDEDNKYCVDCDAKGPRWASWNLGIFLCIRCAGIHRNLGVHISKVKSVNLDTWTPEQVVSLQQMGNSRARAVYEANLPDNFRRPQTDSALEAFVRAKYEQKKYIAREWVPPPIPKNVERQILGFPSDERLINRRTVNWDKELDEEAERQKKRKKEAKQQQTRKSTSSLTEVAIPQLLPKPKGSTSPKPGRPSAESNRTPKQSTQDLLGLDTPTGMAPSSGGNGDDAFTSFLSAPPPANTATTTSEVISAASQPSILSTQAGRVEGRSAEEESFFNQPGPGAQEKRQLTKASILALYGSTPTQQFPMPGAVFNQPAPTYVPTAVSMGFPPVAQAAGIPNGMMASQPMQSAVLQQNGVFGNSQPAAANLASNPFFNMAAPPMVQPTLGYPPVAQEHVNVTNASSSSAASDLMLDFSNVCSLAQSLAPAQLPQQITRLNLGAPMMGVQQTQMMGLPVQQPVPVAAATMGIPAGNPMSVGSFVQPPNSGHTLATNLWQ